MRCPLAVGLLMVTVPSLHSTWTEPSLCVSSASVISTCHDMLPSEQPATQHDPVVPTSRPFTPTPFTLHFAFLCRHEIPPGMARLAIRKVLVTMIMTVVICGHGANGPPRSLLAAPTLASQVTPFRVCSVELRGRDPVRPPSDVLLQTPFLNTDDGGGILLGLDGGQPIRILQPPGSGIGEIPSMGRGVAPGWVRWVTLQPGAPMSDL